MHKYNLLIAASKALIAPLPRIALYGNIMSMTSKVMCFVRAFAPVPRDGGRMTFPRGKCHCINLSLKLCA
jgi:hypothetical protein